jgi:hypothetical protein
VICVSIAQTFLLTDVCCSKKHTPTQSILFAKSSRSPEKTEEYRGEDGADFFEAQESTDVPKLSADCKGMILAGLMGDGSKPIMPHLFECSWT